MSQYTPEQAYHRLTALLARTEHCTWDVATKLHTWGIDLDAAQTIIRRLIRKGYLDEERFCRSFIHDRFYLNRWGKVKIDAGLRAKHIAPDLYEHLLEEVITEADYRAGLTELLHARSRTLPEDAEPAESSWLLACYAIRRGYDTDTIWEVLEDMGYDFGDDLFDDELNDEPSDDPDDDFGGDPANGLDDDPYRWRR